MALLRTIARGGAGCRGWAGWRLAAVLVGLLGCGAPASAQAVPAREYQIKAVFLFNFAQFVEWPPAAFAGAEAPLVIGVLGDDPFGANLDETVRDEKIGQRPLLIRRYRRIEDITTCHILFISRSEEERLGQIVAGLQNRSILTVSDGEGFARRGVIIRFLSENNRIRLRINLEAAKLAGLKISSKLLRPAEIVTGED